MVVRDTNALRAKDIANETAAVFMEEVVDAMKIQNIKIIDFAIEPQRAVAPRVKLNAVIGAMLGLMMGVFFALFKEFTDNTIKSAEDILKYVDLPVIGNVPIIDQKRR